jgi:hypothetical protein
MTTSREPRRRRPWIVLLSVLVAAVVPWLACPRLESWSSARAAREALGALAHCLGDGGAAALRARLLAADLAGDHGYPGRCARAATELEVALSVLERESARCDGACCVEDTRCVALAELRGLNDRVRASIQAAEPAAEDLVSLLAHARAAGLPPGEANGAPPPAPAAPPPRGAAIAGAYDASAIDIDGDRIVLMLHERGRALTLCTIDAARAAASCQRVAAHVPVAGSVLLVDGSPWAPPHLLAGGATTGGWSIYRGDGTVALALPADPRGAAVLRDGRAAAVIESDAGLDLLLGSPPGGDGSRVDRAPLQLPSPLGPPLLHGDVLVWPLAEGADLVLAASPVALPLAPREVARIRGWQPASVSLRPCRSSAGLTVLVTEPASARAAVAFAGAAAWSVAETRIDAPIFGLSCAAGGATLTAVDVLESAELVHVRDDPAPVHGRHVVHRTRCHPSGCVTDHAAVELDRFSRQSRYLVGPLHDTILVLWRARLGEIRLRAAPLDGLAAAADSFLFDDEAHGGFPWDALGAELFTRDRWALLLVQAEEAANRSTYAFVIDANGSARPVRPE